MHLDCADIWDRVLLPCWFTCSPVKLQSPAEHHVNVCSHNIQNNNLKTPLTYTPQIRNTWINNSVTNVCHDSTCIISLMDLTGDTALYRSPLITPLNSTCTVLETPKGSYYPLTWSSSQVPDSFGIISKIVVLLTYIALAHCPSILLHTRQVASRLSNCSSR